jgi:uncharacterized protein YqjF (DUF2071 family)
MKSSAADVQALVTARWQHMAMMCFDTDRSVLEPYVPRGLDLSTHEGRYLLGLVCFEFTKTRMRGIPVPFFHRFFELYLGFFVQRTVDGGAQRGWIFIRKVVPSAAVAWVGRVLYREDYVRGRMRRRVTVPRGQHVASALRYEWQRNGRWHAMALQADDSASERFPEAASLEGYFTENYGAYSTCAGGGWVEFPVVHPPWRVRSAVRASLDCDVSAIYGPEFRETMTRPACAAFMAEGSDVVMGAATKLTAENVARGSAETHLSVSGATREYVKQ